MDAPTHPPYPPPPPPLPAAPITATAKPPATCPKPPAVVDEAPSSEAFLVELLTFNGSPFRDHWAYWVPSPNDPDVGIFMHASGDVARGFQFEIVRNLSLGDGQLPTKRIRLQWVNGKHFAGSMRIREHNKSDHVPACSFEHSAHKVSVPEKSLNTVGANVRLPHSPSRRSFCCSVPIGHATNLQLKATSGKKIRQRDCQIWIVEAANQLFHDGIFDENVVAFLRELESCPSIY